jgi:MFS family permease
LIRLAGAASRTFSSLRIRNYRLYFLAQIVSMSGTWMQSVAQLWLVYRLTNSGTALGVVTALQFAPVLLAGPWGGVLVDRLDKRNLLIATQAIAAILALALGGLTAVGIVELWMIYALAFGHGCMKVVEVPARHSFVVDMVGPDQLNNAVGLNSTVFNTAKVVAPALGGVLISAVGIVWCFFLNAASYAVVIWGLWLMDRSELRAAQPARRGKGQLRDGIRYVWTSPVLRTTLLMTMLIGTVAFNFRVLLPVMADVEFSGGAGVYGALSAFMGVGAVVGALYAASRPRPTRRRLIGSAFLYGVLIVVAGVIPTLELELAALVPMGAAGIVFISTANSTLQLNSADSMRGRVMALYSVVFLGTTPIGSPIAGWLAENVGARGAFFVSGLACFVAAAGALRVRWSDAGDTVAVDAPAIGSPEDPVSPAGGGSRDALRSALRVALRR